MSDIFYIKQNDTSPEIEYQLDPAIDLTGATVVFNMKRIGGTAIIDRAVAEIVGDPTDGAVSYGWAEGDTAKAGTFRAEFEVTYADGSIETFPNNGYIQILITSDLG